MKRKELHFDEFCEMVANEVGYHATPSAVARVLKGTYTVILRQLKLKGRINLRYFGCWEIKQRKSGERLIYDFDTKQHKVKYVKPKYSISFKPSELFDKLVNENDFEYRDEKFLLTPKRESLNFVDMINISKERKEK